MINQQLLDYVRQQLAAGVSKEEISKSLIAAGWQASDVNEALNPTVTQPPTPLSNGDRTVIPSNQIGNNQELASIGQLFSDSFALYKEHFLTLIVLIGIPYLLLGFGQIMGGMAQSLAYILSLLLLFPASTGVIYALSKGDGIMQSFRAGFSLLFSVLWVAILIFFVMTGGFVMLIVPGVIMSIWFSFSPFVLVIEGKRGLNALLQSREYVRGYWWDICVRLLLLYICTIPIYLLRVLLSVVFITMPGEITLLIIINTIITLLINTFSAVYLYKIYQNLTTLKPALAARQPTSGRRFPIASGIVGLLVLLVSFYYFFTFFMPSLIGNEPNVNSTTTQQ